MGSLIMIAITLIAGAGAFGFVNGQTGVAAGQIGNSVANNANYLREKETIGLVNFDNNTGLSIYTYNGGAETLTLNTIILKGPACVGVLTSCTVATQVSSTLTYNRLSNSWTLTGAGLSCTGKAAAGLTSIALNTMARVSIKLTGCTFVYAASPTLPAITAPPLTNSFTISVYGQFGSTASNIVTR